MKNILFQFTILLLSVFTLAAQTNIEDALKKAKEEAEKLKKGNGKGGLTNTEVVSGLKEALTVGTKNSASSASKLDGFNKNSLIRIPFPQEATKVKTTMLKMGMKSQVTKFETTLNRAAEEASKEAAPIFISAIKGMTITDGFTILKGENDAATKYLNNKTNAQLYEKFKPAVKKAIQKVELTKAWSPLISKYNKIPGVQKQNPNLDDYVTKKAIEGLFKLIAAEELKIRKDPVARVSDILKKVFGPK